MSEDRTTPVQGDTEPLVAGWCSPVEDAAAHQSRFLSLPEGPGRADAFVAELVAVVAQEVDGADEALAQRLREFLGTPPSPLGDAFSGLELTFPLSRETKGKIAARLTRYIFGLEDGLRRGSKLADALTRVAYYLSDKSVEASVLMLSQTIIQNDLVPTEPLKSYLGVAWIGALSDDRLHGLIVRATDTDALRKAQCATSDAPVALLLSIATAFSLKWRRPTQLDPEYWWSKDRPYVFELCRYLNEDDAQAVRRAVAWIDGLYTSGGPAAEAGVVATSGPTLVVCSKPFGSETDRESQELLSACKSLTDPLPLAAMPAVAQLQEAQNELAQEFPWALDVVAQVFDELCAKAILGCDVLHLEPTLFVGHPGSGKSRLMRRLGEVLRVPTIDLPLGGSADPKVISGTSRGWSSGRPNDVVMAMVAHASATVAANLDELDKAGGNDRIGQVHSYLLSLLEPETCRRFRDSFLKTECDMSGVIWLATANQLSPLPAPLLQRLRVLSVEQPRPEHFRAIAKGVLRDLSVRWRVPHWTLPQVDDLDLPLSRLSSAREVRRCVEAAVTRFTLAGRRSQVAQ